MIISTKSPLIFVNYVIEFYLQRNFINELKKWKEIFSEKAFNYPRCEANWENPSDKKFGRGMKQFSDKETALKLAKIAAVTDLISTISVDVKNETQSQKSESEKNLYQIVESVAKQNIDYNVVNSYFDEENCVAYVMVELKK